MNFLCVCSFVVAAGDLVSFFFVYLMLLKMSFWGLLMFHCWTGFLYREFRFRKQEFGVKIDEFVFFVCMEF